MKAIFKREFKSYMTTVMGPLFISVMIAFMGIYFVAYNLIQGYPYFGVCLSGMSMVVLLAVPVLTMRSFAEEKKTKTDQLLFTSPVSVTGVVLGKYFAMVTVLGISMIAACIGPIIVYAYGGGAILADYGTILAFFLMVSAYIAIGMFVSSLTENQVIAAVGTFAILLVLQLIDGISTFLPALNFLSAVSLVSKFSDFINQSFDITHLIYFISVACVFVFLTVQSIQKRRWS